LPRESYSPEQVMKRVAPGCGAPVPTKRIWCFPVGEHFGGATRAVCCEPYDASTLHQPLAVDTIAVWQSWRSAPIGALHPPKPALQSELLDLAEAVEVHADRVPYAATTAGWCSAVTIGRDLFGSQLHIEGSATLVPSRIRHCTWPSSGAAR
jgi:hypothetical protein